MTHRREVSEDEFSGLRELDRIVSQVISAIREPTRRELPKSARTRDDNVIYKNHWKQEDDAAPDEADTLDFSEIPEELPLPDETGEDPFPPDEADMAPPLDWDGRPDSDGADDAGPLSEAESAFVERTARWLERRANRDVIMDQIWRRLLPPLDDVAPPAAGDEAAGDNGDQAPAEPSGEDPE